jgi:hypothetical protein
VLLVIAVLVALRAAVRGYDPNDTAVLASA